MATRTVRQLFLQSLHINTQPNSPQMSENITLRTRGAAPPRKEQDTVAPPRTKSLKSLAKGETKEDKIIDDKIIKLFEAARAIDLYGESARIDGNIEMAYKCSLTARYFLLTALNTYKAKDPELVRLVNALTARLQVLSTSIGPQKAESKDEAQKPPETEPPTPASSPTLPDTPEAALAALSLDASNAAGKSQQQ